MNKAALFWRGLAFAVGSGYCGGVKRRENLTRRGAVSKTLPE